MSDCREFDALLPDGKYTTFGDIKLAQHSQPIVVDLDDTLIVTDTLYEQMAVGLFRHPRGMLRAVPHLLKGRAALKATLAKEVAPI